MVCGIPLQEFAHLLLDLRAHGVPVLQVPPEAPAVRAQQLPRHAHGRLEGDLLACVAHVRRQLVGFVQGWWGLAGGPALALATPLVAIVAAAARITGVGTDGAAWVLGL